MQDYDDWLIKIRYYKCGLRDVPKEFRTAELCMEAVKKDPAALKSVPSVFRTAELYL